MDALKYTCQLVKFKTNNSNIPKGEACCVLLEFNNQFFALSCAHVLGDGKANEIQFIIDDNKSGRLGGKLITSSLPQFSTREDDLWDLAVMLLNTSSIELLKVAGKTFLRMADVVTGYTQNMNDTLLIAGYPASKTKAPIENKRVKFSAEPFLFFTQEAKNFRDEYATGIHFFGQYPRKSLLRSSSPGTAVGPIPNGLSGSGFWQVIVDEGGLYRPQLIGIFTEYHDNRSLIIATKIDHHIEVIRKYFDSTIPNHGLRANIHTNKP
jgi:hypothetical protein